MSVRTWKTKTDISDQLFRYHWPVNIVCVVLVVTSLQHMNIAIVTDTDTDTDAWIPRTIMSMKNSKIKRTLHLPYHVVGW